jgi:thioredoxin 2
MSAAHGSHKLRAADFLRHRDGDGSLRAHAALAEGPIPGRAGRTPGHAGVATAGAPGSVQIAERVRVATLGAVMSSGIHVPCGACLAVNRVPEARLSGNPICGKCKERLLPAHPVTLDDASFTTYVERSDLPVVVDFWADWCAPCKAMAPQFAAAARSSVGHALFAKVDTEAARRTAARFAIRSIPTLVAFDHGHEIARQSGALSEAMILRWVAALPR